MTNPVPGYVVSTPYKKTGSMWTTCGWHTGQDYAAPTGTRVVAARSGTVKHVNYGSAFGSRQVAVQCSDGTEDFYAHMSNRAGNGSYVYAGDWVGAVGAEGNVSGPHLHFERHKVKNSWTCSNMDDPMKSHNDGGEMDIYDYNYSGKPSGTLRVGTSYVNLDIEEWDPPKSGLEGVLTYLNCGSLVFEGGKPGRIRIRLDRGNDDYSGYQDYVVVPGITELLITHTYFEQGDGTKTWVGIKCLDGLKQIDIGTRYCKRYVIKDNG